MTTNQCSSSFPGSLSPGRTQMRSDRPTSLYIERYYAHMDMIQTQTNFYFGPLLIKSSCNFKSVHFFLYGTTCPMVIFISRAWSQEVALRSPYISAHFKVTGSMLLEIVRSHHGLLLSLTSVFTTQLIQLIDLKLLPKSKYIINQHSSTNQKTL